MSRYKPTDVQGVVKQTLGSPSFFIGLLLLTVFMPAVIILYHISLFTRLDHTGNLEITSPYILFIFPLFIINHIISVFNLWRMWISRKKVTVSEKALVAIERNNMANMITFGLNISLIILLLQHHALVVHLFTLLFNPILAIFIYILFSKISKELRVLEKSLAANTVTQKASRFTEISIIISGLISMVLAVYGLSMYISEILVISSPFSLMTICFALTARKLRKGLERLSSNANQKPTI